MGIVLTVGSINMDVVAFCRRAPSAGETVIGERVSFFPGGKGANQAVAAAKSGADSRLIGTVGTDGFGAELLSHLKSTSVDVSSIVQDSLAATGVALITVENGGSNRIVVVPGANLNVRVSPSLCAGMIGSALVALAQFETNVDAIEAAFEQVRSVGGLTLLNPSPLREVPPTLARHTSGLILNEIEFGQLFNFAMDDLPQPEQILKRMQSLTSTYQVIVVTLGSEGCIVKTPEGTCERVAGHSVEAVDSTGAGDCFAGALGAALASGSTLIGAAEYANAAAAISVTRLGAGTSAPTREEVLAFLRS
jgi:ribokinase